ncbi:MAG: DUF58 domain-containing protein [Mariprofundales bacterium]
MNTQQRIQISANSLISLQAEARLLGRIIHKARARGYGAHTSCRQGRGMEFDESRLYQAGDDVRALDWKVTARTGKAHTKIFREERERPLIVGVDLGASMRFATRGVFKSVQACKIAMLLAWQAQLHGDHAGGLLFAGNQHAELRPARNKRALLHLCHTLSTWSSQVPNKQQSTDIITNEVTLQSALQRLQQVSHPGSMVVVISDFLYLNKDCQRLLTLLARHCDIRLIHVYDILEKQLPIEGLYPVHDGKQYNKLHSNKRSNEQHTARFTSRVQNIKSLCNQQRMRYLACSTQDTPQNIIRQSGL